MPEKEIGNFQSWHAAPCGDGQRGTRAHARLHLACQCIPAAVSLPNTIHQGGVDVLVLFGWARELATVLTKNGLGRPFPELGQRGKRRGR